MKKATNEYTMTAALSASLFLLGGCWQFTLEPVQAPYVTRQPPYIASLQFPYKHNEKILEVIIGQEIGAKYDHTHKFKMCWYIKAIAPICAQDFAVTIGDIPQGFRQLVPQDGQSFVPINRGKYVIRIITTNSHVSYCGWWMPITK